MVSTFTSTLSPGMIVRALVNNNAIDADNVDLRVVQVRQHRKCLWSARFC